MLKRFIAVACVLLSASYAFAQQYPAKPVKLIVPYTPGGGADGIARSVAEGMTQRLGQPVVVENRGGANTIIGSEYVASQPADGYTLLLCVSSLTVNQSLYKVNYDALRSFTPISILVSVPLVLVTAPSLPVKSVHDVVALAKARPGELTFASYGSGSSSHLAGELMKTMAGIEMLHVPYKGSSPSLTDVVAERASMSFSTIPPALPLVKAGRLKAIAVTSPQRLEQLKDLPTVAESGLPGFDVVGWNAICAPGGTPRPIVDRLYSVIRDTLATPATRDRLVNMGYVVVGNTPDEFAALMKSEAGKWAKVIQESHIKIE